MTSTPVEHTTYAELRYLLQRYMCDLWLDHLPNLLFKSHLFNDLTRRCGKEIEVVSNDVDGATNLTVIAASVSSAIGERVATGTGSYATGNCDLYRTVDVI